MSETICRIYASREPAEKAIEALRKLGYADLHLVARTGEGDSAERLAQAIAHTRLAPDEARHYAERVARGSVLVVVHTLFGGALRARMILDGHGPIDSGLPRPTHALAQADSAAQASGGGWFKARHPFEALTGWSTLTKEGWMFSDRFGWKYLTDNPHPFSSAMGWKLLSENPHPFSSMMGWKLLSEEKRAEAAPASAPAKPPSAAPAEAAPEAKVGKGKATSSAS